MRYKLLGRSGLRVSELCLGAGTFGKDWGPLGSDHAESRKIFDLFAEAGGNFIDTSNRYQEGTSERLVGEFTSSNRDHFVIGSKYTLFDLYGSLDDPNGSGSHRKNLRRSVEGSLKRLKTDYIDVLWVHIWEPLTPIEEMMRALDDLIREGKALYVGASNLPAWAIAKANTLAEYRGLSPFIATQIEYNLVERTAEPEFMPMCQEFDMAICCWSALSGGMVTGKYNRGNLDSSQTHRLKDALDKDKGHVWHEGLRRNQNIMENVVRAADQIGRPPVQIALNWLRQHKIPTIPIFSARTVEQMREDMGCLEWTLTPEELQLVDRATEPALTTPIVRSGYPHDFNEYGSPAIPDFEVKKMEYGTVGQYVDNHRELKVGH